MATAAELLFAEDEYRQRLQTVRQRMLERGADVAVIDAKEHLFYLTGFGPSATMYQACIVPLEQDPIMVLRRLDEPTFLERTWLRDYVVFGDAENPVEVVARTIRDRGWGDRRIAAELDSNYLPVQYFEMLRGALPGAAFVSFAGVLRELRLRKSPQEIAYHRQAAAIADEAMRQAIAAVGVDASEREAAIAASRVFLELGADTGHVGPIASGTRTNSLHGGLGNHRLEPGDLIHMELVPQVYGYSARLMRPTVVGQPSPEQQETVARLIEIQDREFAAIRPGVPAKDVDRVAREAVLSAGLREVFDNTTGYTLGYYGTPHVARSSDFTRVFLPTSDWPVEPGMVFHMYLAARGIAVSETILVTDRGHERLTQIERQLFVR